MNRAGCRSCGDVIESKHRHNHVSCRCGGISIDGGDCYFKRSFACEPPVLLPDDAALAAFRSPDRDAEIAEHVSARR